MGTTTVTFTAVDPAGNVATTTVDVTVFVTPRGIKEAALQALQDLPPTGDNKTDKSLEKAIEAIEDSLNPAYWLDDSHLTGQSKKVFDEEKKALDASRSGTSSTPITWATRRGAGCCGRSRSVPGRRGGGDEPGPG